MAGLLIDNPVTLLNALASDNVIPGDTLQLRAGTYSANYVVPFSGNASNWITIKPYQNERVIINGQMAITGNYIRVMGLESTNNTNRDRNDISGTVGFDCLGNYNEIVNCLIHDHDQGITTSRVKTGHIYYGNLFYFNGQNGPYGHGTYPQNNVGNSKIIRRNIFGNNFGYGIHAYGGSGDVSSFVIDGNTCFENGSLLAEADANNIMNILNGGSVGCSSPRIYNNMTYTKNPDGYGGRVQVGYGTGNTASDVQIYDNYFVAPRSSLVLVDATLTRLNGNTIIGWASGFTPASYPDNAYTSGRPNATTYPASGTQTFLTSNAYDSNRAQLTIYNWTLGNTVNVDVSAVFGATGTVESHNAQDYFTDIQTLTITAGVITVNMQAANRTVATPVGWTAPAKTYPQFGSLILVKTA
jgi:hypothetical protein